MTAPVTSLVDAVRRTLIEDIARADSALAHVLLWPSTRRLDAHARTRVRMFVEGDRVLVAVLCARVSAASTMEELQAMLPRVRQLSSELHGVILAQLLGDLVVLARATRVNSDVVADLQAVVADGVSPVDDRTALLTDLATARVLNAQATLAVPAVRDAVLQLAPADARAELERLSEQVLGITSLLDRVDRLTRLVELSLDQPSTRAPRVPM